MSNATLVIGAGGFIGRHVVEALATSGEHVIAVSRKEHEFHRPEVETVCADLCEPAAIAPLIARSRVVVHVASASTPASSAGQPEEEVAGNIAPTAALLQILQEHPGVNLVYLSSGGALYGSTAGIFSDELAHVKPKSYHGAGKIAAEYFIRAWCSQFSASATILRPSNIYGPGQCERPGFGIVPASLASIERGETLKVWGDGSTIRDYLYIHDFIALCMNVINQPMSTGVRTYNASSGIGVSLDELFLALETVSGKPLRRSYTIGRAVDATCIVMDAGRAYQTYGWSATTSLLDGLSQTWHWFASGR